MGLCLSGRCDMIADVQSITWKFGGVLSGAPPLVAWGALAGAAAGGVAFALWSYRRALVELPMHRRLVLCTLRTALWLGVMVLLAAPTRIDRLYEQPGPGRQLAVLVDRSASMTTPDNRQRRRIDDALRKWHEMEADARRTHPVVKTYVFASDVHAAALDSPVSGEAANATHFYAALRHVLAEAPADGWDGIVTLTDGLDTSSTAAADGVEEVVRAALGKSTALHFLPGRNRYAGGAFLGLRDFNVPARVAPHTAFRVEAIFDSYQSAPRDLQVRLTVNGVARPPVTLRLETGRRLTTWSTEIPAGDPGSVELELHAGAEVARATVRVARPASNRVLYFQGALDWSYRFLADILRNDSSFTLTPVFNFPNPNAVLPPGALRRMPEIPKELDSFDMVILANAAAVQFTSAQQQALSTWVRDGGIVLFFTPDDDSTGGFAGSELEKMLPVIFSPRPVGTSPFASRVLSRFRGGQGTEDNTKLSAFAWEPTPRVKEIFAEAGKEDGPLLSPLFSEYAHVAGAKPGADVLARHATDLAADGSERSILLAIQRYGRGQSAVLTTDALWRWKLNAPASDRSAERFWRALFGWLARERESGLRFDATPRLAEMDHELSIRVAGGAGAAVRLEASIGNKTNPIAPSAPGVFTWRPPSEGLWRLTATSATGEHAQHWITVKKPLGRGELSGLPPDEELMRTLAARTGGSVLTNQPPAAWQPVSPKSGTLMGERREPLWHHAWVLAALVGCYCTEMVLRRLWRLL